jgi:hypothetical protein
MRLAGETHFLSEGRRLEGLADLRTDEGLKRVLDEIYGTRIKSFWHRFAQTVDRTEFDRMLRATDRSRPALFEAVLRAWAGDRAVAGDKSPEHIYAVPTLLSWFPNAAVIHTFRDPRAVYVSLRRKERLEGPTRFGRAARRTGALFDVYASVNLAMRWRRVADLHHEYVNKFPDRYTLLRFEDLLADPEAETRRLCQFIGIPFESRMLDQVDHNSSYVPRDAAIRRAGIDRAAAERWREYLPARTERLLTELCGSRLSSFGYSA